MPSETRRLLLLVLFALALRLIVFPVNEHLYGDAVSRTEMAEAWAARPHVITSFNDGAAQYGPLHLYLVGAALSVFDRNDASRVVSLIFGVLTVLPLFAVTRHYFGSTAATWACLAFGLWGIHIQASTTGGSEALALFLMWVVFAWYARALYRPHWLPFLFAAVALNLATAARYDAWMYVPLLGALPLLQWNDKRRALRYGALFIACGLPFPLFWMAGNMAALGDPLYPLTYIDEFHRAWALASGRGMWREWWLRVQGLGFWPAMALFTLSPGVAVFGLIGMATSWQHRRATRWLVVAAVVPTIYYTFRTAVLLDFVPLGRFTVTQVSLLLPFLAGGWAWVLAQRGRAFARRAVIASAAVAVLMPVSLGAYTLYNDSPVSTVLKPLSPTSTNSRWVIDAATLIHDTVVTPGRTLLIDEDPAYYDLQIAYFARVDNTRTIRVRWPAVQDRVARLVPDVVVTFNRGRLIDQPWVSSDEEVLVLDTGVERVRYTRRTVSIPNLRVFDRQ
jgi:4-amino-4-deoxy-L-arabinose transferase-like glycosyltransferase